jgi:2-aminoethylphosphonate-pyruvate transaminase
VQQPAPITTAVILAAGVGHRLQNLWADAPKGLLVLGGTPIIERSIMQLLAHGIEQIILVTGHRADQYAPLIECYPMLRTVYNPHYATSGSMYSLYCARHLLADTFLLLYSDLIYEDRALTDLLACPSPAALLVSGTTNAGDEVFVEVANEQVRRISKERSALASIGGEMVGITKISATLWQAMSSYAEAYFAQSLRLEYCSGCLNAVIQHTALGCCKIDALIWAEIDDAAQWQRACDVVFPMLVKRSDHL